MTKILLIDDDPIIQKMLSRFLSGEGHEIIQASNGKEGLILMEQERPDLIVTDILMPEMDGFEILLKIRTIHDKTPVIAISGGMRGMPINFLEQAKLFGARHVFEKPVPLGVLKEAINELLADNTDSTPLP
ncbi:response regulator [Pontiellaceae bacterium B12219]|nr:response regulator [Pontiellaceae bacterium B12219]